MRRARVVDAQVGDDHPVDAVVGDELAVGREFCLEVGNDLEHERCLASGQLGFHAGDERREERIGSDQLGGSGEDEPDGIGASVDECPGRLVGTPAEFLDGSEDPPPGVRGNAGTVVEDERHETLGHTGAGCDIDDRRPPRPESSPRRSVNGSSHLHT